MALALIAGTGGLPPILADRLVAEGEAPLVCEMEGFASAVDRALPRLTFRLETLGTLLARMREAGVTRVCMAGAMRRPEIDPGRIDAATAPLVPRLAAALRQGDDGTLRAFVALFEEQGMEVVGATEIAPDLLPALGVPTRTRPGPLDRALAVARGALAEMGRADLGQALVVRGHEVIAREDDQGTDAMLGDLCGRDGAGTARGAVLYKAPKPGQDRRVDLPAIGIETARAAAAAGLGGIVIEAGGVIVLDRDAVVEVLDAHHMFLAVVAP